MAEHQSIRSIGVIGTPGCGKTTLCESLNLPVINLQDYAEENGCLGDVDSDGSAPVDVETLAKLWQQPTTLSLVDSHLAHFMPVDALIVLRCPPAELKKRLELRDYSAQKVQQNVEVEMLGGPWNELLDDQRPIFEGSEGVSEWIKQGCPANTTPDTATDWLSRP
jgi:adenylate kinase